MSKKLYIIVRAINSLLYIKYIYRQSSFRGGCQAVRSVASGWLPPSCMCVMFCACCRAMSIKYLQYDNIVINRARI